MKAPFIFMNTDSELFMSFNLKLFCRKKCLSIILPVRK